MDNTIAHYRIVSELGRGGMGVVYKAHEESLNRFVALKVLGSHLSEDVANVERFTREARAAAALNHPNIVQVYAIGEHQGQPYFAMEYVSGTPLLGLIRERGSIAGPEAAHIIAQAADALAAAHEIGIIHRDIKPANILLTAKGLVKIADFGLALAAGGGSRLTATGWCMGTPGYLSPEQCLDQPLDARTDIYSLGVTLYEMLTGTVPFTSESPLALFRKIVEVEPPPVSDLKPDVDPALKAVVAKMMAKDRNARYGSCAELGAELGAYLERVGMGRVSLGTVGAVAAAPVVAVAPTPSHPLDVSPTLPVPSGKAGSASTRPPAAPPAAAPEPWDEATAAAAPVVVAPPATPPRRRSAAPVIVVLLAVAALAMVALGLGVAWKLGLLRGERSPLGLLASLRGAAGATGDAGESAVGTDSETDAAVAGLVTADALGAPEEGARGALAGSAAEAGGAYPVEAGGTEVEAMARPSADSGEEAPSAGREQPAASGRPLSAEARQLPPPRDRSGEEAASDRAEPPAEDKGRSAAAPIGVVVVGIGEPLLDGAAEAVIERGLELHGATLVDERGLPGVWDLVRSDGVTVDELVATLRPAARHLIVARVEYLGDRQIAYLGRYDTVHQARLHVVAFDLASGQARGPGIHEMVEYTKLDVERKAAEALRQPLRRVFAELDE